MDRLAGVPAVPPTAGDDERGRAVTDDEDETATCRRYGCRHQAREHGFVDGEARCWRCEGDRAWHPFTRADRTGEDAARDRATTARMRKRRTWNGPGEGRR